MCSRGIFPKTSKKRKQGDVCFPGLRYHVVKLSRNHRREKHAVSKKRGRGAQRGIVQKPEQRIPRRAVLGMELRAGAGRAAPAARRAQADGPGRDGARAAPFLGLHEGRGQARLSGLHRLSVAVVEGLRLCGGSPCPRLHRADPRQARGQGRRDPSHRKLLAPLGARGSDLRRAPGAQPPVSKPDAMAADGQHRL